MKKGSIVTVSGHVHARAKDGSWVDVRFPTLPPRSSGQYGYTEVKRKEPGGWYKTVRVPTEMIHLEGETAC